LSSSSGTEGPGRRFDERAIDRRLLALLIARHGEPPRAPPLSADDEERLALIARRDRALAAADPALVHHLERHARSSETLCGVARAAAALAPAGLVRAVGLDRGWIQVREVGEVREVEVPEDLSDAMEHRTPQAFLRDLHRPVQHFGDVELRRAPVPTAAGSLNRIRRAVSEAMAQRAGAAATIRLASPEAHAGMAELREILARPWEESRPANPLPMPSRAPSSDDMMWFGMSGGYDPDQ